MQVSGAASQGSPMLAHEAASTGHLEAAGKARVPGISARTPARSGRRMASPLGLSYLLGCAPRCERPIETAPEVPPGTPGRGRTQEASGVCAQAPVLTWHPRGGSRWQGRASVLGLAHGVSELTVFPVTLAT